MSKGVTLFTVPIGGDGVHLAISNTFRPLPSVFETLAEDPPGVRLPRFTLSLCLHHPLGVNFPCRHVLKLTPYMVLESRRRTAIDRGRRGVFSMIRDVVSRMVPRLSLGMIQEVVFQGRDHFIDTRLCRPPSRLRGRNLHDFIREIP